ncbi:hypothetical protein [Hymenobacter cellulosivorans]|uniref:Beta-propeller repeat protein n=1 Tax=Hymenobacter cellulosivorans TaxID=2932249 RepID=A0ABY4FDH0_9BACT|nr:hypothetical protein [Hymenobacter cellulosivorans]UOQ54523.1 hypothetical protein MUN80_07105 [Hymenobacter cellulosivorans]
MDAAGDLYVAGAFGGRTLTLGATTLTNTCSNPYGSDLYVAKLSSGGQWLWAYQASGPGSKDASRIALDASGNVYLTGNFGTSATFGSTTLTSTSNEVFVAKISAAGQWQWAVKGGSEKQNTTNGLQTDASGNVYVTGSFRGVTATFGSFSLTNSSAVAGSGLPDLFVAKLSAAGQWQWVTKAGGYNSDYTVGLGLDAGGNVYVAGLTEYGLVSFGSISVNVPYESRVFVAKLNPTGQWQWVTLAGGTAQDHPSALLVDAAGNTYLTGNFTSPRLTLGSLSLDKPGQQAGTFVAKMNSSGQWQWAAQNSGTENVSSNGLTLDAAGNVFVTGHYIYGSTTFGTTTLTSSGTTDLFVARLNGSGQWQWAVQSNGGGESSVHATATDAAGNVYVTGIFTGTLLFGPTTLSSQAGNSLFVAKRSAAGQWLWVKQTTGSARYGKGDYFDRNALAVDGSGNVYLTGSFRGNSATFGSSVLSSLTGGYYGYDAFVAKLDASGQWQWAVRGGGTDDDSGSSLATDGSGRVYVSGHFYSTTAQFGSLSVTSSSANRNQEVFVARLDADGQWQWASSGGGATDDRGSSLALDASGNVYIAGSYQTAATFGPSTLNSPGYSSAYVAKLNAAGQWQWATGARGSGYYGAAGIATDASGNAYVTGFVSGGAAFDNIILSSTDSADVYVAKVNPTGQWQWATLGGCAAPTKAGLLPPMPAVAPT